MIWQFFVQKYLARWNLFSHLLKRSAPWFGKEHWKSFLCQSNPVIWNGSDHQYSSSVRSGLIWMWSAIKHRTQPMLLTVIQLYWTVDYTFDIADSSNNLQVLKTLGWVANMFGIFFVMAGHEHYSIDVFIAFYLSTRFVISHSEKFSSSFCERDNSKSFTDTKFFCLAAVLLLQTALL